MKPEEQRTAIAQACGWKPEKTWHLGPDRFWGEHPEPPHTYQKLPDYLNDMNAMHEAEVLREMHNDQRWAENIVAMAFRESPVKFVKSDGWDWVLLVARLTAAQRAEVFLITEGLWTEN